MRNIFQIVLLSAGIFLLIPEILTGEECPFCKDCPECQKRMALLKAEIPKTPVDRLLVRSWKKQNLTKVPMASDEIFLRRVMLNAAGILPAKKEVQDFIRDKDPDKRKKLIDRILDSKDFADVMTMRFADMLRIKSEFPINLWPNAVQAYYRQIHADILADRSYRDMAYDMLTESGSNFRKPYANFFRASADRKPLGLAKAAALTFMGIRTGAMKEEDQKAFAEFFSRIRYKSTDEWKEEIVYTDPTPAKITARTPDGKTFRMDSPEEDPRKVFAGWLLDEDNPYFARAFVNRMWHYYFGKGLIDPADAMPVVPLSSFRKFFGAEEKECVNQELLDYLTDEFRKSGYSIKTLSRIILNSKAYQASSVTKKEEFRQAEKYFAVYPVRRMEAEIIVDMLGKTLSFRERYMSVIPEPFTYIPNSRKSVQIDDGSISSGLLDKFGKPSRDSGELAERKNAVTNAQRLFLMNSSQLFNRTVRLGQDTARRNRNNPKEAVNTIYLTLLSRYPTKKEMDSLLARIPAGTKNFRAYEQFCRELVWSLVNTKEFIYYH